MLIMTIIYAFGIKYILNPIGYTVVFSILAPVVIGNSVQQIESFAPPGGAPPGPIELMRLAVSRVARSAVTIAASRGVRVHSHRAGLNRLRFLIAEGPQPLVVQGLAGGNRNGRRSSIVPQSSANTPQVISIMPDPENVAASQNSLPPCERQGVSYEFLLAVCEAWNIPNTMTTYEICEKYIRPACGPKNTCFTDLLLQTGCPKEWLGKMDAFVSHWWVEDMTALFVAVVV